MIKVMYLIELFMDVKYEAKSILHMTLSFKTLLAWLLAMTRKIVLQTYTLNTQVTCITW